MRIAPLEMLLALSVGVLPFSVAATRVDASSAAQDQEAPPSDDSQSDQGESQFSRLWDMLFDGQGLPLLRVSAPTYMQFGARPKLRAQPNGGLTDDGGGGGGGGNNDNGGGGDNGNGGDGGDGGDDGGGGNDDPPGGRTVPEPTPLLMLAPAAAFLVRRFVRR